MTDPNSHITNLESPDRVREEAEQARSEHMANPTTETQARLGHALALQENNQQTMALIESEWGPIVVGKPKKTKFKSSELLAQQGYVGIYRRV